jgi:predicted permease
MSERRRPPRLAIKLLEWRLPPEVAEAIAGDLAQAHAERVERRGRLAADLWIWAQALTIRAGALQRAAKRVRAAHPSDVGARHANGVRSSISWLDVKLGLRMLRKHPVMTAASLLALAVGIPASMLPGHIANVVEVSLPEDPEDRIRSLRYWNEATQQPASPSYFELARWRGELATFEAIGAFRASEYNVSVAAGSAAPASGAEVTGSAFELLGAVPLHGRTLDRRDERPGVPDVVVVGHDLWQARLGGDPDAVGTTLVVAGVPRTIVGVMPPDFLFPARQQLWLPLTEELVVEPARGRALEVFGRLAEGASPEDAAAEVDASGRRLASEFPGTNERLDAQLVRFGVSELRLPAGGWRALNDHRILRSLALILLGVACTNVAMLVFARTATRFRELAIRTSLGASRRRIVAQMFAESLVLALGAVVLGLLVFQWSLLRVEGMLLASETVRFPPYWLDFGFTWPAVVGALAVAMFAASVAGVLPALKVTGTRIQENIQRAQAGRSGVRFGGVTGALIVADVAIAVAVVGLAVGMAGQLREALDADARVGIPAAEYLAVEIALSSRPATEPSPSTDAPTSDGDPVSGALAGAFALTQQTLVERLESDPRVRSVAVADALPRQDHRHRRTAVEGETIWVTVEGTPGALVPPLLPVARVDVGFFEALGQPILSGRGFGQADLQEDASTAIVNTSFVERRMGGRNPIGQRIRFWVGAPETGQFEERWYQIIGTVGPLGMNVATPEQDAGVYLAAAPGHIQPLRLAVHVAGDPEAFVPALRAIVGDVDAGAVLQPPRRLDRVVQGMWYFYVGSVLALAVILGILVALAASGVYAIMSFAVSERTREIGIRTALGERGGAVAARIGLRSIVQVGLGAVLGMPMAMFLYRLTELGYSRPGVTFGFGVAFAGGVGVALFIGVLACLVPTRRALSIEPTEALKGEG